MTPRNRLRSTLQKLVRARKLHRMILGSQQQQSNLHSASIGGLRVMLVRENSGEWAAQGLEIDYAAQGLTVEDAKLNFQEGLAATVALHLRTHGTVERMLRIAPQLVWDEFLAGSTRERFSFSDVSIGSVENGRLQALPFDFLHFAEQVDPPVAK